MNSVLHFVLEDDEAAALVAAYREAMPSGSYLMLSHANRRVDSNQHVVDAADQYSRRVAPMKLRSLADVARLLEGFEIVEPGVVYCAQWRADPADGPVPADPLPQICALARKP